MIEMLDLIIIGCGPRGLAVALEAKKRNLNFKIIDSKPLNTWENLKWYDFNMRSPITFDLVDNNKIENSNSLLNFVKKNYPDLIEQKLKKQETKETTYENIFISRSIFIEYLKFLLLEIKDNLVQDTVEEVNAQSIKIKNSTEELKAKKIVIAIGSSNIRIKKFIKNNNLNKVSEFKDIYKIQQAKILVIGSGQAAGEYVYHFAKNNQVKWLIKKNPKVYQYPIPDQLEWGWKNCFGNYFKNLTKIEKINFIQKVKNWQPSITPEIYYKLKFFKDSFEQIKINNKLEFNRLINEVDYILLTIGQEFDLNYLSFKLNIEIKTLDFNPKLPELNKGFKSSESFLRFTGLAAVFYDGLRQGSVNSAYNTAIEILDN